jgi:hypothetical protein
LSNCVVFDDDVTVVEVSLMLLSQIDHLADGCSPGDSKLVERPDEWKGAGS